MNKKLKSTKILKYAKKLKSIIYKGGHCKMCRENNIFKLIFHHRNSEEKDFEYSDYNTYRWSILKEELDKCDLLCQNCHREIHYKKNKKDDRRLDKKIYLEYSSEECIKCGYNKCTSALTFHHRNPNEKSFSIGCLNERIKTIDELSNIIKSEIDKCDVLCSNCHILEHSDIIFYEQNKIDIEKKAINYKEKQNKIDRDKVIEMFDNGSKQIEIANYFNASKGTISGIIKKYKIKNNFKV